MRFLGRLGSGLIAAALVLPPPVAAGAVPSGPDLARPTRGTAALQALGDDLPAAARLNGVSPEQLRRVLSEDRTAWLDRDARLYFVEPAAPARPTRRPFTAAAPFDLGSTFDLHSLPGSSRTIYLDLDGGTVSGTRWNADNGVTTSPLPAWDLDGRPGTFNDVERTAIQSIWARVAEDYAPFDVDVTTEDPGAAAIDRSSPSDQVFGTRALVTPSESARAAVCGAVRCGGIAYVGVFDHVSTVPHSYYQPAWVFPQSLGDDTKNLAEAISHEVGHNLGLFHDGLEGITAYYDGHGPWAPIMGVGYNRPLTQWSQGSYLGANEHQDDLAVIAAGGAPLRRDEAGGVPDTASPFPRGPSYVSTREDRDVFELGRCSGDVVVSASPAAISPDLDVRLELLDASGATVVAVDPPSATDTFDVATGLGATVRRTVPAGRYYARVDGVGRGAWSTFGYDDYASLGSYTLSRSGCADDPAAVASAPRSMAVTPAATGTSARVTWAPPADDGGSDVTAYRVSRSPGDVVSVVGAGQRSTDLGGLTPGTRYTFGVAAVTAAGRGARATLDRTTPEPAVPPTAPRSLAVAVDAAARTAVVSWQPPASPGSDPVVGYDVTVDGRALGSRYPAGTTGVRLTGLRPGARYVVAVRAANAAAVGPFASVTVAMPSPPSAPAIKAPRSGPRGGKLTATARWGAPASTGGDAVTGYQVAAFRVTGAGPRKKVTGVLSARARSHSVRLPAGTYRFAVRARNDLGWGAWSKRSATVRAR